MTLRFDIPRFIPIIVAQRKVCFFFFSKLPTDNEITQDTNAHRRRWRQTAINMRRGYH